MQKCAQKKNPKTMWMCLSFSVFHLQVLTIGCHPFRQLSVCVWVLDVSIYCTNNNEQGVCTRQVFCLCRVFHSAVSEMDSTWCFYGKNVMGCCLLFAVASGLVLGLFLFGMEHLAFCSGLHNVNTY